jgi:hypothetical protein
MKNRFELNEKDFNPQSQAVTTIPVPIRFCQVTQPPARKRFRILILAVLITVTGCSSFKPLKAGKATAYPKPGGLAQTLVQSENPSQPSRQEQETIRVRTYTVPLSASPSSSFSSSSSFPFSSAITPSLQNSTTPFGLLVSDREETRAKTELGASQKDKGREFAAKLSSLKNIIWVGLGMFILGIASFFWAPLRVIIGSVTTSAAITIGGLALMFLPTLIVGHEVIILGGVALGVGAWFLAHRHGRLHGELSTTRRFTNGLWN